MLIEYYYDKCKDEHDPHKIWFSVSNICEIVEYPYNKLNLRDLYDIEVINSDPPEGVEIHMMNLPLSITTKGNWGEIANEDILIISERGLYDLLLKIKTSIGINIKLFKWLFYQDNIIKMHQGKDDVLEALDKIIDDEDTNS